MKQPKQRQGQEKIIAHGIFVQLERPVSVIANLAFLVLRADFQVVFADVREPSTVGDLEWAGIAMCVVFSGGDFICLDLVLRSASCQSSS